MLGDPWEEGLHLLSTEEGGKQQEKKRRRERKPQWLRRGDEMT